MFTKEEEIVQQNTTITPPASKKKKTVSWNDMQSEGKISTEHLKVDPSASPTKRALNAQMTQLVEKEGYSELEAAAFTGKPLTLSGEVLITEPSFYDSPEIIQKHVAEKKENKAPQVSQEKSTNNNFFKPKMMIGMPTHEEQENTANNSAKRAQQTNENMFFSIRRPLIVGGSVDVSALMALAQFNYK